MQIETIPQTILYIILILVSAKIFGELAVRIGQPPVLGELIAGVIIGSSVLGFVKPNESLMLLAELGAILLLFEVGLESDLEEFLRVGPSAFLVAAIGVIGPFAAGYFTALALGLTHIVAIFIGATLTATSVGITARTLSDLGRLRTPEAKIILGAAVIDDIMGLIILAVVTGLVATGKISIWQISKITILAITFLVGAIVVGIRLTPLGISVAKKLRTRGALTTTVLLFCLTLAYIAHELKLATIVGAFAAGLVLARTEHSARIQDRIKPLADILIPIFFVMLGTSVNMNVFNPFNPATHGELSLLAIMLTVAVTMKIFAGLGVLRKNVNRLIVGIGMIPRGEVGLIFASVGLSAKIITSSQYSAIIGVVIVSTFITPPLLKLFLRKPSSDTTLDK